MDIDKHKKLWYKYQKKGATAIGSVMAGANVERKAFLTCSYAVSWFAKHPEYSDVLEDVEVEQEHK